MTQRTDIHRPSAIVPTDYDFVGFECIKIEGIGDCEVILREREHIRAHMERTGGTYSRHEHGGNCMICGNVFAHYTVLFYHRPSNVYVRAGQDCAQKLEMSDDTAFNYFTAGVRDARAAVAGKRKAQALLTDRGLIAAWEHRDYVGGEREEQTLRDMVRNLIRYGSWSEKQFAYAAKLLDRIATRAERLAQQAAEAEAAAPCPTGRVSIRGTVLTTRVQESHYSRFGVLKMLVKDDSGFKVWGTVPTAAGSEDIQRGARIAFKATVKPSPTDPKFGFFKRPVMEVV